MDQEKIGKFIAKCRKAKNMTQQELADKLNITDRAISNWETGRRLPDYAILKDLCEELGVTINELLSGEKLNRENYQEKLEENMVDIVNKIDKDNKKRISIIKKVLISYLIICLIFLGSVFGYFFYNYDMINQKYDKNNMYIKIEDNNFVFYSAISGNVTYKIINYNKENILLINYKSSLKALRKHSDTDKISSAYCLNNIKNSEEINKVYYTNIALKKFNNQNKIKNLLAKSYLIYEKK